MGYKQGLSGGMGGTHSEDVHAEHLDRTFVCGPRKTRETRCSSRGRRSSGARQAPHCNKRRRRNEACLERLDGNVIGTGIRTKVGSNRGRPATGQPSAATGRPPQLARERSPATPRWGHNPRGNTQSPRVWAPIAESQETPTAMRNETKSAAGPGCNVPMT